MTHFSYLGRLSILTLTVYAELYNYAIHESDIVTSWGHMASDPQPVNLDVALNMCDKMVSCAGVSFRSLKYDTNLLPLEQDLSHVEEIYYHNFLPHESSKSHEEGWYFVRSENPFTLLAGRILSKSKIQKPERSHWTLASATSFCSLDPDCIGFSFPTTSSSSSSSSTSAASKFKLEAITQLSFHTKVLGFRHVEDDSWRSYLVNDPAKTLKIDPLKIDYDDYAAMVPYGHCCNHPRSQHPTTSTTKQDIAAVDTLERVDCHEISMAEFHERYEKPRKPVILVGCAQDWPATTRWTFDRLLGRFPPESPWRVQLSDDSGIAEHSWQTFAQTFMNSSTSQPAYVFDQLDHDHGRALAAEYTTPPQFRNDVYLQLKTPFPNPDFGPRRWFSLGNAGSGTLPRVDPVATDSWNTLLQGHKWWILYPPQVTHVTEVECDSECTLYDEPQAKDWFAGVGEQAGRTLFASGSVATHVLQRPGETLYVPQGQVHAVLNMEPSIAITENYGSVVGNLLGVWRSVLSELADQPQMWRAMYYTILTQEERKLVRASVYWPPDVAYSQIQEEQAAEEAEREGELYGEDHEDDVIHCEDHDYDCIKRMYPVDDEEEASEEEFVLPTAAYNAHEEL